MTGAWEYFGSFFPKNPVIDIFLTIMSVADLSIYYVISVMFHIILKLSEYNLDFLYDEMQNRIYLILGIFMLFKMIVSLLTYFVNPDQINDKEQGMGKLVTKIIIMLMMLIAFPNIIFPLMNEAQSRLLVVIPRIVSSTAIDFNVDSDESTDDENSNFGKLFGVFGNYFTIDNKVGEQLAVGIYRNFFALNDDCDDNADQVGVAMPEELKSFPSLVTESCYSDSAVLGSSKYRYTYVPFIPTIVGVISLIILIGTAFQVAVRALKLIILKILAPIAIVSYVDPKSSKGNGVFSNWLKALTSTWADLFIKLGVFYLGISILSRILSGELLREYTVSAATSGNNFIIQMVIECIIIIALLFFIWKIPQYIKSILGIKEDKEFGKIISLGKVLSGAGTVAAVGAGTVASGISAGVASAKAGGTALQNVGAGLFAGVRGANAGINAAKNAKSGGTIAAFNAVSDYNMKNVEAIESGRTLMGSFNAIKGRLLTGHAPIDEMNSNIDALNNYDKILSTSKSVFDDRVEKDDKHRVNSLTKQIASTGRVITLTNANTKELVNAIKTAEATGKDVEYGVGNSKVTMTVGEANYMLEDLRKKHAEVMMNFAKSGTSSLGTLLNKVVVDLDDKNIDNAVRQGVRDAEYALRKIAGKTFKYDIDGVDTEFTFDNKVSIGVGNNEVRYDDLKVYIGNLKNVANSIKNSKTYDEANASAKKAPK